MKISTSIRIAFRRAGSLLLAGLILLPEMLPLGMMSAGITASAMLIFSGGKAEARGGAVRRPVRRTTRRVVRRTGRRVAVLGAGASLVYLDSTPYYSWNGAYYQKEGNVYVEIEIDD
jgi:hypothetical protein